MTAEVLNAVGTTFTQRPSGRKFHTFRDLHVYQLHVDVQPAPPKLKLRPIGGADGSIDLSDQPAGWPTYGQRVITWIFGIPADDDVDAAQTRVNNALNGRKLYITLDSDPEYYYDGRLAVVEHKLAGDRQQIIVKGYCQPYKLKQPMVRVEKQTGPEYVEVILKNAGQRHEIPKVFSTGAARIEVFAPYELTWDVGGGNQRNPDFWIPPSDGVNTGSMRVTVTSLAGQGMIRFEYEEAQL